MCHLLMPSLQADSSRHKDCASSALSMPYLQRPDREGRQQGICPSKGLHIACSDRQRILQRSSTWLS